MRPTVLFLLIPALLLSLPTIDAAAGTSPDPGTWEEINPGAPWAARAGLQVLRHRGQLYLMGGRTPNPPQGPFPVPGDSQLWGDVWRSRDRGESWKRILETDDSSHWPARAYFKAVKKGRFMYVLGGQNFQLIPNPECPQPGPDCPPFLSVSEFFNDCWRSSDGIRWQQLTGDAGFEPRAGLMAAVLRGCIYVFGGSQNDDSSIIGGPPQRIYFNDVWKSCNGRDWKQVSAAAPWEARAGGATVVKNGYIYLLGGENGFLCQPQPFCDPPYFNDVWRTRDGVKWQLVTEEAEWSPRPGHQAVTLFDKIYLFGGFGQSNDPADPFKPSNPMDVWVSRTGRNWTQISDSPWNASGPADIKYDFAAATVYWVPRVGPSIFTFGGDRETFNFLDPTNYLNIDNDVWRFSPFARFFDPSRKQEGPLRLEGTTPVLGDARPNPFNPATTISFSLPSAQSVRLAIYDLSGRRVALLLDEPRGAGDHSAVWRGVDDAGRSVASGMYLYRLEAGDFVDMKKMVLLK